MKPPVQEPAGAFPDPVSSIFAEPMPKTDALLTPAELDELCKLASTGATAQPPANQLYAYKEDDRMWRKCSFELRGDVLEITHISNKCNRKGPFQITSSQRENSRFGWSPGWRLHTAAGGDKNPGSYWISCNPDGIVNGLPAPVQMKINSLDVNRGSGQGASAVQEGVPPLEPEPAQEGVPPLEPEPAQG